SHANRIYEAAGDGDPTDAIRLAGKIKKCLTQSPPGLPHPFRYRHITRKGWAGFRDAKDVYTAMGILEDRDWVIVRETSTTERGGRPTEEVWVHPKLLTENWVDADQCGG